MGSWGSKPWENDSAADWFSGLFETIGLAERVEDALNADVEDEPEIVRAAAYVLLALGEVYIWPIDKLDEHRQLAAERLQAILDADTHVAEDPDTVKLIKRDIKALRGEAVKKKSNKTKKGAANSAKTKKTAGSSKKKVTKADKPVNIKSAGVKPLKLLWEIDLAANSRAGGEDQGNDNERNAVTHLHVIDEDRLLCGTNNSLRIVSVATGKTMVDLTNKVTFKQTSPFWCGVKATKDFVVLTSSQGVSFHSTKDGSHLWSWFEESCTSRVTPDGRLAAIFADSCLLVVDAATGEVIHEFQHERPPNGEGRNCVIRPDGKRLVTSRSGSLRFWDLEQGKLIKEHRNKYAEIHMTSDGRFVVSMAGTGPVLWDVETAKKVRKIEGRHVSTLGQSYITPDNQSVMEMARGRFGHRPGEVVGVDPRKDEDGVHVPNEHVIFDWLGDRRIVTWRDIRGEKGVGFACELRVWDLHPAQLVATHLFERSTVDEKLPGIDPIPGRKGELYRVLGWPDGQKVIVGDGDARVYAFTVPE